MFWVREFFMRGERSNNRRSRYEVDGTVAETLINLREKSYFLEAL